MALESKGGHILTPKEGAQQAYLKWRSNPEVIRFLDEHREKVRQHAEGRGGYFKVQGDQEIFVFGDEHVEDIKEEKKQEDLMLKRTVEQMCHDVWKAVQADREFKRVWDKSAPRPQPPTGK
jgi:hypothetical protein